MADLFLDHNVPRALGELLAAQGHTSRTVRQLRLEVETDDVHLLRCWREGWTFLTHDSEDYTLLHAAWTRWAPAWGLAPAPSHFGIVLLPQIGAAGLAGPVGAFLASAPPLANQLYAWAQDGGWLVFDASGWRSFSPT